MHGRYTQLDHSRDFHYPKCHLLRLNTVVTPYTWSTPQTAGFHGSGRSPRCPSSRRHIGINASNAKKDTSNPRSFPRRSWSVPFLVFGFEESLRAINAAATKLLSATCGSSVSVPRGMERRPTALYGR